MYYVELLRVRRALIIATVVLAIVLGVNCALWSAGHVVLPKTVFTIPLTVVWAVAGFVASIFATVLGGSLANENDGHLQVAWTKPVSKTVHALTKMSVDLGAAAVFFGIMCLTIFAYFAYTGLIRFVSVPGDTWLQLLRFLVAPAAFYGLTQALTSSLGRQAGIVLGLTWVGLLALLVLDAAPLPNPYHALFDLLNYANPIAYLTFQIDGSGNNVFFYGLGAAIAGLVIIAICGGAAAIYRWQRVEA